MLIEPSSTSWWQAGTAKTELVIFHRRQKIYESITIGDCIINSKQSMKILGIWFDCNFTWSYHVQKLIETVKRECFGLRKLRNYFSCDEMKQICTAFAYSKFYYGCQIWFLPSLHKSLRKKLLSLSALVLRSAFFLHDWKISNVDFACTCWSSNSFTILQIFPCDCYV